MPAAPSGSPACAMNGGGRALQHRAADDRGDRDDRRGRRAQRLGASRAAARIGPIEMTGFDGPITIARAPAIASSTAAVGCAVSMPSNATSVDRALGALADQELLEAGPAPARRARACAPARRTSAARARATPIARGQRGVRLRRASRRPPRRRPRSRHQARSRSPRANHVSGAPSSRSSVHRGERVAAQAPAALVDPVGEPEARRGPGRGRRRRRGSRRRRRCSRRRRGRRRRGRACRGRASRRRCRRRGRRPARPSDPGDADAGVRLVLDVQRDQQRRQRLGHARELEPAGVDRRAGPSIRPISSIAARLRVAAVAADEHVLVELVARGRRATRR